MAEIRVLEGDITKIKADAIVNAANNRLILGAGVAGAIRSTGGPSIQEECNRIGPIEVGNAAITGAGLLPAKFVIHAASMVPGGQTTEPDLKSSVAMSLILAEENGCRSIAFPAIGTGIAGFPVDHCAKIMKQIIDIHLSGKSNLETIYLVLISRRSYNIFKEAFES